MPLITTHDVEWAASLLAERPDQLLVSRLVEVNRQTPGSYTSNADELARMAGPVPGFPTAINCGDVLARIRERHRLRIEIAARVKRDRDAEAEDFRIPMHGEDGVNRNRERDHGREPSTTRRRTNAAGKEGRA